MVRVCLDPCGGEGKQLGGLVRQVCSGGEQMTGDNRCRCETCNCNTNATRKVSLDKLPGDVLVVQLECFLRVSETRSTKIHAKVAVDPSLMLACPDTAPSDSLC